MPITPSVIRSLAAAVPASSPSARAETIVGRATAPRASDWPRNVRRDGDEAASEIGGMDVAPRGDESLRGSMSPAALTCQPRLP